MPDYLCCYDYGTGGIWLYVRGSSRSDITNRHPLLTVVAAPPNWLTQAEDQKLRDKMDDPFWQSWLANLGKQS